MPKNLAKTGPKVKIIPVELVVGTKLEYNYLSALLINERFKMFLKSVHKNFLLLESFSDIHFPKEN